MEQELFLDLPPRNSAIDFRRHGYEVIAFVGRGRFGHTFQVRSLSDSSIWLAKMIDLTYQDEKSRQLSLQEAELMKGLAHPFVVDSVESFMHEDTFLVIIMEYCEGGDLMMHLSSLERRPLDECKIRKWVGQLISALHYVHSKNVLHRDLKPSNIFLDNHGNVKIGDFGISLVLSSAKTVTDTTVGTPHYMPPEVCNSNPYTFKSDIWSLGCIIYEMCALESAFSGESLLALVWNIAFAPLKPISCMYSMELWNLISAMLSKRPADRPTLADIAAEPFMQSVFEQQQCGILFDNSSHSLRNEDSFDRSDVEALCSEFDISLSLCHSFEEGSGTGSTTDQYDCNSDSNKILCRDVKFEIGEIEDTTFCKMSNEYRSSWRPLGLHTPYMEEDHCTE